MSKRPQGRPRFYPLDQMKVGDVFDVPRNLGRDPGNRQCRRQNAARRCIRRYVLNHAPEQEFKAFCLNKDTVRIQRFK